MFSLLKAVFKRTARPSRQATRARLGFETLETRELKASDAWTAVALQPKALTEQVGILFPVFQKAEVVKVAQRLSGIISPESLPAVQNISPEILPAVQQTSPEFAPVGHTDPEFLPVKNIDLTILSLAYDSANVQK